MNLHLNESLNIKMIMVIYDSYLVTNLHTHTLCAHVFDRIACNYNSIRWCVSTNWNSHFYFYTWSNDIYFNIGIWNSWCASFSNIHGTSFGFEIKTILRQKTDRMHTRNYLNYFSNTNGLHGKLLHKMHTCNFPNRCQIFKFSNNRSKHWFYI